MKKKQKIILSLAIIGLVWISSLGIHYFQYVRAYCSGHDAYGQPGVYVFMRPDHHTLGIPFVIALYRDVLPYPLQVAVTVDDRIAGQGAVIEAMEIEYDDGTRVEIIRPEYPRKGPFKDFKPAYVSAWSDKVPGRTYKRARIDLPEAISHRGSFRMSIRGYIYGDWENKKVTFERTLKMDYSRETKLLTGWKLLEGLGV